MTDHYLVASEHETLRVPPHGRLPAAAREAFIARIPELPAGALTITYDGVRTAAYCGLVKTGDWVLEILPKIYGASQQDRDRGLLMRMLGVCFDLPIWQEGEAPAEMADELLTVLIRSFIDEAIRQFRQGPLKIYVGHEEYLTRPRGRLNLAEQIRRGRARGHELHCEFDEFTADNAFNRVVKAALGLAAPRLPAGSALKTRADHLFVLLGDIQALDVTVADVEALPRNRLTERYRHLLTLAAWIIQLLGPGLESGEQRGLSLLFDMNRLFQEFVSALLLDAVRGHPHRHRLELTFERPVVPLVRDWQSEPRFMLRPDFCLRFDGEYIAILDTKWKLLDPADKNGKAGVAQEDLYQMLAYGHTYRCRQLRLVYPHYAGLSAGVESVFRFAPHKPESMRLTVNTFDLDKAESEAAALLDRCIREQATDLDIAKTWTALKRA